MEIQAAMIYEPYDPSKNEFVPLNTLHTAAGAKYVVATSLQQPLIWNASNSKYHL
jgi:hypothetical protein